MENAQVRARPHKRNLVDELLKIHRLSPWLAHEAIERAVAVLKSEEWGTETLREAVQVVLTQPGALRFYWAGSSNEWIHLSYWDPESIKVQSVAAVWTSLNNSRLIQDKDSDVLMTRYHLWSVYGRCDLMLGSYRVAELSNWDLYQRLMPETWGTLPVNAKDWPERCWLLQLHTDQSNSPAQAIRTLLDESGYTRAETRTTPGFHYQRHIMQYHPDLYAPIIDAILDQDRWACSCFMMTRPGEADYVGAASRDVRRAWLQEKFKFAVSMLGLLPELHFSNHFPLCDYGHGKSESWHHTVNLAALSVLFPEGPWTQDLNALRRPNYFDRGEAP